ncbi:MAG: hypothetical protein JNK79_18640 [Chitinophagaceae bacterium]|nr:hypothetical protein [Chitinophagaceae bacterium]
MHIPQLIQVSYSKTKPRKDDHPEGRSSSEFSVFSGFTENSITGLSFGFTPML